MTKIIALAVCLFMMTPDAVSLTDLRPAPDTPHLQSTLESPSLITLPVELGRIEESYFPRPPGPEGPPKTVVYIPDAHVSFEAQENTAKIIHYLVARYGVRTVFEEGYEGPVPTDAYFGFLKGPEFKEKIARFLMDRLRLSGAEYAHITRKRDFRLIGADDRRLHLKNLYWYRRAARNREEIKTELTSILREIKKMADRNFPKSLKQWLNIKERWGRQKLPLAEYLKRTAGIYREHIPAEAFRDRYPLIHFLLAAGGSKDREAASRVNALDGRALFLEIEDLEEQLAAASLDEEQDRQIFRYLKALDLLERLNEIEITQEEFAIVRKGLRELKTSDLAAFIAGNTPRSVVFKRLWERKIHPALHFYETAEQRNETIIKRLDPFIQNSGEDTAVLVFGGFHKARVRELLKTAGLSYVIVAPRIHSLERRHHDYYRHLMSGGRHSFEVPRAVAHSSGGHGFQPWIRCSTCPGFHAPGRWRRSSRRRRRRREAEPSLD